MLAGGVHLERGMDSASFMRQTKAMDDFKVVYVPRNDSYELVFGRDSFMGPFESSREAKAFYVWLEEV